MCPAPVASASHAPTPSVSIEGPWHGVLGGKLHTVIHFTRQGDKLTGVLDSLDQGAKLPLDGVKVDGDKVHFEIAVVSGSYEGKLEGGTMTGTWTQYGVPQPLSLERGEGDYKPAPPQKPLDAPIDVVVTSPPMPLRADDKTHLVYELHVSNVYSAAIDLTSIDVSAGGHALLHTDERTHVGARGTATVFMWVTLDAAAVPAALDHRIVVHVGEDDFTVPDVRVAVVDRAPPVLASPLRGSFWKAVNGPSNGSRHRRALIPVSGHAHISQRFAVDWVKLADEHGLTYSGDPLKNTSYFAYGQQALAVADGVVTEVKDGIQENVPQAEPVVPITLETIAGNHVIVDIGGGRWAHFQPGSVKVKVGDHVKRGQVLGLVGNSGNSTEPHLHFHVSDGSSVLASEGVPYAFESFEIAGKKRSKQLPTEREIVTFP